MNSLTVEFLGEDDLIVDLDELSVVVHYNTEDWDTFFGMTPEQQIRDASLNENDLLVDVLEDVLGKHGLEIDRINRPHIMTRVSDSNYTVKYFLKRI